MSTPRTNKWPAIVFAGVVAFAIVGAAVTVFLRSRDAMQDQIRERLRSTAAVAALHIDGDMIDRIEGPDGMRDPIYTQLVNQLDAIRKLPNIRFVYILRRTSDPAVLEFVADADGTRTDEELDVNGDGEVDTDEQPSYPGDLYEISGSPALREDAFEFATSDDEITVDQWGALISGYAPVRRSDGSVAGVLGIDMRAEDFLAQSQRVLSVPGLVLVFLFALLVAIAAGFVWEFRQVRILGRINDERSGLLRLTFHQLGEPLTIMKWSLETLREETDDPQLKKLVEEHVVCMDEGLGRLNSIIDTLQLAEKVDLDSLQYLPVQSSLRELIDNAVGEWDSSMQKRNQHMHVFMKDDVQMPIDRNLLPLVLRQLLQNAIEYSDDGTDISIHVEKQRHGMVEIRIQDEGCGIPPEDMLHLFEKYRRASNAPNKKPDGNGLGMYIARGIVLKAGGRMHVESELNKGTTVIFTLPLS